ncbi:hypothetical protein F4777DRAFT_552485 [Nemania sp. FL0916]|nr:hypothetical protein F4777DRAFT_552485 [Nemania sp. FL0916]
MVTYMTTGYLRRYELIAPQKIEFLDVNWVRIGSKASFTQLLSEITRIDKSVLLDSRLVSSVPIARRTSWAAERETTGVEDIAYCLFGISDVNIPTLYGEGAKVFRRLQEEIIKKTNDFSILAFLNGSTSHNFDLVSNSPQPYCPLLAISPRDFMTCVDLVGTEVDFH